MGILETTTLVLIILKLTGLITWSWPIVLTPFFVGLIISISAVLIYVYIDKKSNL